MLAAVCAGVFDVHTEGQSVFDCGNINTEHGFQLLEAFHFALQQVNAKQGEFADILNGVTLGGVGLDACQSAIRGGYLVSNINNRLTTLERDGDVSSQSWREKKNDGVAGLSSISLWSGQFSNVQPSSTLHINSLVHIINIMH